MIKKQKITDILKTGKILMSDGAWGTYLHQKGLKAGECPDEWSLTHYSEVRDIAKSYIDAGSDMVQTNSFGANRIKLMQYGLEKMVEKINEAAAQASREAAGDDKYVIASVGPTGKILMTGDITETEMYDAFCEQVVSLEKGGADAICIETMSDTDEAELAIKAAKRYTSLEVITTFTFEKTIQDEYRTMMGYTPSEAVRSALHSGTDIVGANCGNGMVRMFNIVKEIRDDFPKAYILVHANAGLPTFTNGVSSFPETPEIMAACLPALIGTGVNIIGGCCGTTPEHIRAMKEKIERL